MEQEIEIEVLVAGPEHEKYVDTILQTIAEAAKVRGTGIAKRTHEYLTKKMQEAKAVIALTKDGQFAGFSYIETWENQQYVTTSGLIVHPDFRGHHVAKRIKDMTFSLARTRWPHALERLRRLLQRRRTASYRPEILYLYGDAVRPDGTFARQNSR